MGLDSGGHAKDVLPSSQSVPTRCSGPPRRPLPGAPLPLLSGVPVGALGSTAWSCTHVCKGTLVQRSQGGHVGRRASLCTRLPRAAHRVTGHLVWIQSPSFLSTERADGESHQPGFPLLAPREPPGPLCPCPLAFIVTTVPSDDPPMGILCQGQGPCAFPGEYGCLRVHPVPEAMVRVCPEHVCTLGVSL